MTSNKCCESSIFAKHTCLSSIKENKKRSFIPKLQLHNSVRLKVKERIKIISY